ncbi:hypothetical protein SDC9_109250 [bioreactor metagenome]|uniref:Uncharacterized protein n=1 Tax=bioreactor metagenome TaxID=1076179 RepID=A0A645BA79_9ZZZZ
MVSGLPGAFAAVAISWWYYAKTNKSKGTSKPKKQAKKSGKEKASDAPNWAKQKKYNPNKSASENARKALDDKYGKGKWKDGPGSEFSQIKKWLQRSKGYK